MQISASSGANAWSQLQASLLASISGGNSSASGVQNLQGVGSNSTSADTTSSGQTTTLSLPPPLAPASPSGQFGADTLSSLLSSQSTTGSTTGSSASSQLFSQIDGNGDGEISLSEFQSALGVNTDSSTDGSAESAAANSSTTTSGTDGNNSVADQLISLLQQLQSSANSGQDDLFGPVQQAGSSSVAPASQTATNATASTSQASTSQASTSQASTSTSANALSAFSNSISQYLATLLSQINV